MSPTLPGSRGLFSALQNEFSRSDRHRIRLNAAVFHAIADFRLLADSLHQRPTRLRELVPTPASNLGACDACRTDMGGVWFDLVDPSKLPIMWRHQFPDTVQKALITSDNPTGCLSICDLELTAVLTQKALLASLCSIQEQTIWISSDNTAAVSWSNKGPSSSDAVFASLLRFGALHQRQHRYLARHHHMPGPVNSMADNASRLWHLSDAALLTHFNLHFPHPTAWQLHTLPLTMTSELISLLCSTLHTHNTPRDALPLPAPLGTSGQRSASLITFPHSTCLLTPSLCSRSSPNVIGRVASRPAVNVSDLGLCRTPNEVWGRPSDCLILGFYFLLRPGEYLGPPASAADDLSRVQDVKLFIGTRALSTLTCPPADLDASTFVSLTFTTQKNDVRDESNGHGRSGHPILCPVLAVVARIHALRALHAKATTPLNTDSMLPPIFVTSGFITAALRSSLIAAPNPAFSSAPHVGPLLRHASRGRLSPHPRRTPTRGYPPAPALIPAWGFGGISGVANLDPPEISRDKWRTVLSTDLTSRTAYQHHQPTYVLVEDSGCYRRRFFPQCPKGGFTTSRVPT